jgi:hypothetical protein
VLLRLILPHTIQPIPALLVSAETGVIDYEFRRIG